MSRNQAFGRVFGCLGWLGAGKLWDNGSWGALAGPPGHRRWLCGGSGMTTGGFWRSWQLLPLRGGAGFWPVSYLRSRHPAPGTCAPLAVDISICPHHPRSSVGLTAVMTEVTAGDSRQSYLVPCCNPCRAWAKKGREGRSGDMVTVMTANATISLPKQQQFGARRTTGSWGTQRPSLVTEDVSVR